MRSGFYCLSERNGKLTAGGGGEHIDGFMDYDIRLNVPLINPQQFPSANSSISMFFYCISRIKRVSTDLATIKYKRARAYVRDYSPARFACGRIVARRKSFKRWNKSILRKVTVEKRRRALTSAFAPANTLDSETCRNNTTSYVPRVGSLFRKKKGRKKAKGETLAKARANENIRSTNCSLETRGNWRGSRGKMSQLCHFSVFIGINRKYYSRNISQNVTLLHSTRELFLRCCAKIVFPRRRSRSACAELALIVVRGNSSQK